MKMKAITAVCATGASVPTVVNNSGNGGGVSGGRVSRHRDGENAEIQMYLSKLKDLVPFMPKNRKLSKLEIIQHVIDYICDLQTELETHPAVNSFDAVAALNERERSYSNSANQIINESSGLGVDMDNHQLINRNSSVNHRFNQYPRQPLSVRPYPNTILTASHSSQINTAVIGANSSTNLTQSHIMTEKHLTDDDRY